MFTLRNAQILPAASSRFKTKLVNRP